VAIKKLPLYSSKDFTLSGHEGK